MPLALRLRVIAHGNLPLSREIDRFAEDAGGLLRGMEAHRVLGFDEVEEELRLALKVLRPRELPRRPGGSGGLEFDEFHERVHRQIAQGKGAVLNGLDARLELVSGQR